MCVSGGRFHFSCLLLGGGPDVALCRPDCHNLTSCKVLRAQMILLSIIRNAYARDVTFNLDVSEQAPEVRSDETGSQERSQQTAKLDDLEDGDDNSSHLHAGSFGTETSSETSSKSDIFLHFEVLAPRTHRAAQSIWVFLLAAGVALCATTIYFQTMPRNVAVLQYSQKIFKLQTSIATVCLSLLAAMLTWFLWQLRKTQQCAWKRRQKYLVAVAFLELLAQFINALFWLTPNAYILTQSCSWFDKIVDASTYIRWTCWNLIFCLQLIHVRNCMPALNKDGAPDRGNPRLGGNCKDPMRLDANFWTSHWLPLLWWACVEASIIFMPAAGGIDWEVRGPVTPSPCGQIEYRSQPGDRYTVVTIIWAVWLFASGSAIRASLGKAQVKLQGQPYNCYQFANLLTLWQHRQSVWMQVLGLVEAGNLYFGYSSLLCYIQAWTGQLALQVLITGMTVTNAFYYLPVEPGNEEHVYQAWLQEFAWTSEQVPRRQQVLLKRSPTLAGRLDQRPMFVFEEALKLVLWSDLVYECSVEDGAPGLTESDREGLQPEACGPQAPQPADSGAGRKAERPAGQSPEPASSPQPGVGVEASGEQSEGRGGESPQSALVSARSRATDDTASSQAGEEGSKEGSAAPTTPRRSKLRPSLFPKPKKPHVVVKVEEVLSSKEQMLLGMQMFQLTDIEVIHEPLTDTKAVVAWNGEVAVLAFRGTQSLANVRTDAKAWRAAHPPQRGLYWLGTRPMVHQGFLHAWTANGLGQRVLDHFRKVLAAATVPRESLQVFLTGHSLGGAIATLAAFDIQKTFDRLPRLTVMTFGAPRTGNAAFAQEFGQLVPNCWHVINDKDAVPRSGKMLGLYKRPGERVLINHSGDIRVRPTIFEVSLHTTGWSVKQHLLTSYLHSLASICIAQLFKYKRLNGGLKGVRLLAQSPEICKLLASIGADLPSMLKAPPPLVEKSVPVKGKLGQSLLELFVKDLDALGITDE